MIVKRGNRDLSFLRKGAGPAVFSLASRMSDPPANPINNSSATSQSAQLQLVLQLLDFPLGFLVVEELVHRLLHVPERSAMVVRWSRYSETK